MRKILINAVLLIVVLLLFPLNSASANMGAPFGFGSSSANLIVDPKNVLSVKEEYLRFEVSHGDVYANITYKIVNSGEDGTFTFVFPALNVYHAGEEFDFKVKVFDKEIKYEVKTEEELRNLLKDNSESIEKLLSFKDEIFFDPLTGKEYTPQIGTHREGEKVFFIFSIFLKKDTLTEVNVSFKSFAGFDARRYQINILHYYYILDVKDFYKTFENVKIEIVYPKTYPLKSNFEGTVSRVGDKNILTIELNNNFKNLSFSYMEKRLSKIQVLTYRAFPFLFGESFFFFLILLVLPLTVASIFVAIVVKWSNKHFGRRN
jgi:hypothetical protein